MALLEKEGWLPLTFANATCFYALNRRMLAEFGWATDHWGEPDKSRPGFYLRGRPLKREQHLAMITARLPEDCRDLI
jgi:hypothetical protein